MEVWTPFMGEWLHYVNFTSRRSAWRDRQWKMLLKLLIEHLIQKKDEERFFSLLAGLRSMPEPDTSTLITWAENYIHPEFEGEAILSVGKTVDYIRKQAHGVINAMPFSCMPGGVVDAVLKRLKEDYAKFPALTLSFDGQRQTNILTRLEAFVYQVKQFKRFSSSPPSP
jgi:predicted nucleotide-binding protein (sugar kinase/HSP70/actin superfamily)